MEQLNVAINLQTEMWVGAGGLLCRGSGTSWSTFLQ